MFDMLEVRQKEGKCSEERKSLLGHLLAILSELVLGSGSDSAHGKVIWKSNKIRTSTTSSEISSSEWVWHFVFSFLDFLGGRSESRFVRHSKPTTGFFQDKHSILNLTGSVAAI